MKIRCYGGLFDGREVEQVGDWPQREIAFLVPESPQSVLSYWLAEEAPFPTAARICVRALYRLARTYDGTWVYVAGNVYAHKEPDAHSGDPGPGPAGAAGPLALRPRAIARAAGADRDLAGERGATAEEGEADAPAAPRGEAPAA